MPIGVFLHVGLDGIGIDEYEEHFWELRPVLFQYLYVGLPALDAVEYVQGSNWLGVALAALMRIPRDRVAWLGAEALRKIAEAPLTDQRRFLLGECIQAYLPLDEEQQHEFEKVTFSETTQKVKAMNTTWYEKGVEKGWEEGREEGLEKGLEKGRLELVKTVADILEDRFPPLPAKVHENLQGQTREELTELLKRIYKVQSLRELGL